MNTWRYFQLRIKQYIRFVTEEMATLSRLSLASKRKPWRNTLLSFHVPPANVICQRDPRPNESAAGEPVWKSVHEIGHRVSTRERLLKGQNDETWILWRISRFKIAAHRRPEASTCSASLIAHVHHDLHFRSNNLGKRCDVIFSQF